MDLADLSASTCSPLMTADDSTIHSEPVTDNLMMLHFLWILRLLRLWCEKILMVCYSMLFTFSQTVHFSFWKNPDSTCQLMTDLTWKYVLVFQASASQNHQKNSHILNNFPKQRKRMPMSSEWRLLGSPKSNRSEFGCWSGANKWWYLRRKSPKMESCICGCFQKSGVPQKGWFIMENLIKMDDLGGPPLFLETPSSI